MACGEESDAVARFKQLLSSAPSVSEITFATILAQDTRSVAYYTAACDGTNFYIRRHFADENVHIPLSPTNLMRFPYFLGRDGENYWEISGLNIFKSGLSNGEPPIIEHGKYTLDCGLAFGFTGIEPGSFEWDQNRFTAKRNNSKHIVDITKTTVKNGVTNIIHFDTKTMTGELMISNGLPYRTDSEAGPTIYYDFTGTNTLPVGVPSTVTIVAAGHPRSEWAEIISILRYKQDSSLPDAFFKPERNVAPQYASVYHQKNLVGPASVTSDNSLNVANAQVELVRASGASRRRIIIAGLVVVTLTPLIWTTVRYLRKTRVK